MKNLLRKRVLYFLLVFLPVISACQQDEEMPEEPRKVYTVRASLPENVESRTHITYGNTAVDREIFQWDEEDYITVFNVSRLSECPDGIQFEATKINGREAIFESLESANETSTSTKPLIIKAGDMLFVNYWDTERIESNNNLGIFKITQDNKPQIIVDEPTDPGYMSYMKGILRMYAIVTAVEDDKIPDVHFTHLSAIMRVTLRNETGAALYPKTLEFKSSTASFFRSYIYCSVATDGSGLGISEENSYTEEIQTSINNYTAAGDVVTGGPIAKGETYDLYIPCVPRIANKVPADSLTIRLEGRLSSSSDNWYEISLTPFDVIFEAGKRYWFNLTAVEGENGERKLMFTKAWEDAQSAQKPDNGE